VEVRRLLDGVVPPVGEGDLGVSAPRLGTGARWQVDDPGAALVGGDAARRPRDRDRPADYPLRDVDAGERRILGVDHPGRVTGERDAAWRGADGDLGDNPVGLRVDDADGVGRDAGEALRASAGGERDRGGGDSAGEQHGGADGDQHRAAPAAGEREWSASGGWSVEARVLGQDHPFELLEAAARVEAELGVECAPRRAIRLERVRLAARAVEGEHQLLAQSLAQRVGTDERLQLGDERRVPAVLELGVDPGLDRGQAELFDPLDLAAGEVVVGDLVERRAAPERERLRQRLRTPVVDRALETVGVELARLDAEQVAGLAGDEPVAELLAQERDRVADDLRGRRRRRALPQLVDDSLRREHVVAVQEQERDERELPAAAQLENAAVVGDLQRAEDPELHRPTLALVFTDLNGRWPTCGAILAASWRPRGTFRPAAASGGRERKEREMKRTIVLVLAVAALVVPTALAQSPVARINAQERARGNDARVVGLPARVQDPVARIEVQERGRRLDQRLFAEPSTTIQVVESGGFHWGDAGIGAATAAGVMLLALGTALVVRSGRVRSA
jgi:hypothetical protein